MGVPHGALTKGLRLDCFPHLRPFKTDNLPGSDLNTNTPVSWDGDSLVEESCWPRAGPKTLFVGFSGALGAFIMAGFRGFDRRVEIKLGARSNFVEKVCSTICMIPRYTVTNRANVSGHPALSVELISLLDSFLTVVLRRKYTFLRTKGCTSNPTSSVIFFIKDVHQLLTRRQERLGSLPRNFLEKLLSCVEERASLIQNVRCPSGRRAPRYLLLHARRCT